MFSARLIHCAASCAVSTVFHVCNCIHVCCRFEFFGCRLHCATFTPMYQNSPRSFATSTSYRCSWRLVSAYKCTRDVGDKCVQGETIELELTRSDSNKLAALGEQFPDRLAVYRAVAPPGCSHGDHYRFLPASRAVVPKQYHKQVIDDAEAQVRCSANSGARPPCPDCQLGSVQHVLSTAF